MLGRGVAGVRVVRVAELSEGTTTLGQFIRTKAGKELERVLNEIKTART